MVGVMIKEIVVKYETTTDFKYDEDLKSKGRALEEFDNYLRSVNKYDTDLNILHIHIKPTSPEQTIHDLVQHFRDKLHEFIKEQYE
jgi:hypothetical protein